MNDPVTSYREFKARIRPPSKPEDDCSEFLEGNGDPSIDQVQIFIEYHYWVKFSRCKPCLSIRGIQNLQIYSQSIVRLVVEVFNSTSWSQKSGGEIFSRYKNRFEIICKGLGVDIISQLDRVGILLWIVPLLVLFQFCEIDFVIHF